MAIHWSRWRNWGVRGISGIAVVGLMVGASVLSFLPSHTTSTIEPPVASSAQLPTRLTCGGGFIRTISSGMRVDTADENDSSSLYSLTSPGVSQKVDKLPTVLTGKLHEPVAGANFYSAPAGDTRGLAANPCTSFVSDTWIVASATEPGSSNQLVLTNPGTSAISVEVTAYGSTGKLEDRPVVVAVPPNSTIRHTLDGLIPTDKRTAFHIHTNAGLFGATLQNLHISGAYGGGVDFAVGSQVSTEHVIPGVLIEKGHDSVLRLTNPGRETTVHVSYIGKDGEKALEGGKDVKLAANSVMDLNLDGISQGAYAIKIASSSPVVAGVRISRNDDIAWATSTPLGRNFAGISGPYKAQVGVAGQGTVKLTPFDVSGKALPEISSQVSGFVALDLPQGAVSYRVEASNNMRVATVVLGGAESADGVDWIPAYPALSNQLRSKIVIR